MTDGDTEEIFLQMSLSKSLGKPDADGNYTVLVEASNENLDLEGQRVLKNALLGSKDYFLRHGVVSKDHLYREFNNDGTFKLNEEFVIGEPVEVSENERGNVQVKCKLYAANNKWAKKFVDLLKSGSTRVCASVGGLKPLVREVAEGGRKVGEVVKVLWDDLALTVAPVNPTVAPATLCTSLTSAQFVKALSTADASALLKENVEGEAKKDFGGIEVADGNKGDEKGFLIAVALRLGDGDEIGAEELAALVKKFGLEWAKAQNLLVGLDKADGGKIRRVVKMAKTAKEEWDELTKVLEKALQGELDNEFGNEFGNEGGSEEVEVTPDDDLDDDDEGSEEGDDDGLVTRKEFRELSKRLDECVNSLDAISSQMKDNGVLQKSISAALEKLGKTPQERKSTVSAMEKSQGGNGWRHPQVTEDFRKSTLSAMMHGVKKGSVSPIDFTKAESALAKSLNDPNFQIDGSILKTIKEAMK